MKALKSLAVAMVGGAAIYTGFILADGNTVFMLICCFTWGLMSDEIVKKFDL